MNTVGTYQASIALILDRHAAYWKSAKGLARALVELDKKMLAALDKEGEIPETLEQQHEALIDAIKENVAEGPSCPEANAQLQSAVREALQNSGLDPAIPSPALDLLLAQLLDATEIEFKKRWGRLADCVRNPVIGGPSVEERPGRLRIGTASESRSAALASASQASGYFDVDMIIDTGARPVLSTGASSSNGSKRAPMIEVDAYYAENPVLTEALSLLRAQTDDIAASAFDAYAVAMEDAVETGHFSAAGIGKSMKLSAKQSLLSIGQQASVKGAFEIAEGVSAYADQDSTGAGKHMAAAGKWFAVAGLAGAGAAAMGGEGGAGGGGTKDRKRDEVAPNGADPEGRGSGKGRVIQRITVIGNPTDGQVGEIKGKLAPAARGRAH